MEIRLATIDDAAGVLSVYAEYCSTPITFELSPPSVEEMAGRIAQTLERFPWLVGIEDGELVGYAYAHAFRDRPAYRWTVETSVYVDINRQAKGVGTALYGQLFDILRDQGFITAMAGITLPNPPSVRLHDIFGFRRLAVLPAVGFKNKCWHDVALLTKQLNRLSVAPPEPLLMSAIREHMVGAE